MVSQDAADNNRRVSAARRCSATHVGFGSKAVLTASKSDFCFTPETGRRRPDRLCRLRARASGPPAVNLCGAAGDQQPRSPRTAARAAPIARRRLRLPMPIVRILVVLLALVSPARAQDGARQAAAAGEAAQAFRVYVEGVTKTGGRPDLTRPEVATLLGRVFDLDALNALPPAQANDLPWLLDWMDAANATNK